MSCVLYVVHGGIGEDGTIQTLLESAGVPFTGSLLAYIERVFLCCQTKECKSSCHAGPGPIASRTCIDKVASSLAVDHV